MSEFLTSVGLWLTPDIVVALLGSAVLFLLAACGVVVNAFVATERGRQALAIWKLIDDVVVDAAIDFAAGHYLYNEVAARECADDYDERFGEVDEAGDVLKPIDPRLAYVVCQLEKELEAHSPFDFDFFAVVSYVEKKYQARN